MTRWSLGAVEKVAPDAASLAAARRLAAPGPWSDTGSTDTLVWGKCQGSGKVPYQVSVDLTGPAYRCSCPSRKFPCKHALALLLLWVRSDGAIADAAEAAGFADAWAAERAGRSAAAAAKAAVVQDVDPAARARRLEERMATMSAGIEDFARWLTDLVRGGFAAARRQPWSWWDAAAARLVDAQLPGLADQLREMAGQLSGRQDWAEHLLLESGRWWTAVHAWRRWDVLDDDTRGDLRVFLGWAQARDDVAATQGTTGGRWQVLGAHRTDDGRLQQQRTWLRRVDSTEVVQVLDFAAARQPLPVAQLVGSVLDAELTRYPGHGPRRGAFVGDPVAVGQDAALPAGGTLSEALGELAAAWATNPWAQRVAVCVTGALQPARADRPAVLADAQGLGVPLLLDEPWELLARTGGRSTTVFGELEASGFRPLTVTEVA